MPWSRVRSTLLALHFHHLVQDGWKLSLKKAIMPGEIRNLTFLWLLANGMTLRSTEGESRTDSFPSSVGFSYCPCCSVWEQLGMQDSCQGQILILIQQDNSYVILEQEGCTAGAEGPRVGQCLHWIQMFPPQMFISLLMATNPSSSSCCLFGKSQPLTALILNRGSVGGLLSKGAWKITKKILSTGRLLKFLRRRSVLPLKV